MVAEEAPCGGRGSLAREGPAQAHEPQPEQGGHHAVDHARQAHHRRQDADRPQGGGIEQRLPAGAAAIGFRDRQQRNAGGRIVVAIQPRDGQEVRHLPHEHDAEEHQRRQRDLAGRRAPTDHWW
jgi:hypothetical protein